MLVLAFIQEGRRMCSSDQSFLFAVPDRQLFPESQAHASWKMAQMQKQGFWRCTFAIFRRWSAVCSDKWVSFWGFRFRSTCRYQRKHCGPAHLLLRWFIYHSSTSMFVQKPNAVIYAIAIRREQVFLIAVEQISFGLPFKQVFLTFCNHCAS